MMRGGGVLGRPHFEELSITELLEQAWAQPLPTRRRAGSDDRDVRDDRGDREWPDTADAPGTSNATGGGTGWGGRWGAPHVFGGEVGRSKRGERGETRAVAGHFWPSQRGGKGDVDGPLASSRGLRGLRSRRLKAAPAVVSNDIVMIENECLWTKQVALITAEADDLFH